MDELLQAIEQQYGYPADMVMRSAQARAQADGVDVEAVLRAWAGEGPAPAAGSAPTPAPAAEPIESEAPATPAEPAGPSVEVLEPTGAPPQADEVEEAPAEEPEPVTPTRFAVPTWLVAVFIIIPAIAVAYAAFVPNGPDCGGAGQLAVDPVTGEAATCDGNPYGLEIMNFFSIGETVYLENCTACHGIEGGGGTGPAFTGGEVLATFPVGQCLDHVLWVGLGTNQWPEPTYGAPGKPVGGSGAVMPGFEGDLSPEELAAVVLYERVAFGGQPVSDAEVECGLSEDIAAAGG